MESEKYKINELTTLNREIYFKFASKFLPIDRNAIIVDLGCGDNKFSDTLKLGKKYNNLFLLDGNKEALEKIDKEYKKKIHYTAPAALPFKDNEVDYIHCSHLIEHLDGKSFLLLMKEISRVLKSGSILVISTPIDWELFFGDVSHVRPYPIDSIIAFLVNGQDNPTYNSVKKFEVVDCIYRYYYWDEFIETKSSYSLINYIIAFFEWIKKKILKIRKHKKNGYTVVLRKK